jgi:hypothetical protein
LPDRVKFHRACPGLPSKAKHSTRQRAEGKDDQGTRRALMKLN